MHGDDRTAAIDAPAAGESAMGGKPPPVYTPDGAELLEHLDPPLRKHGHFRRPRGLPAFAGDSHVRIIRSELAMAVPNFPLAFLDTGEGVTLVALLGLLRERNLFLSPGEHEWLGSYIPAWYRLWPFRVRIGKGGKPFLTLREGGEAFLTDDPQGAEALHGADGLPSPFLTEMNRFANRLRLDQTATDRACRLLRTLGLLEPWPIRIALEGGGEEVIRSYQRIDEGAFLALPNSRIIALRERGVLPLVYGQLFSMRNMTTLSWMHRLREHHETARLGQPRADEQFLLEDLDHFHFEPEDLG